MSKLKEAREERIEAEILWLRNIDIDNDEEVRRRAIEIIDGNKEVVSDFYKATKEKEKYMDLCFELETKLTEQKEEKKKIVEVVNRFGINFGCLNNMQLLLIKLGLKETN